MTSSSSDARHDKKECSNPDDEIGETLVETNDDDDAAAAAAAAAAAGGGGGGGGGGKGTPNIIEDTTGLLVQDYHQPPVSLVEDNQSTSDVQMLSLVDDEQAALAIARSDWQASHMASSALSAHRSRNGMASENVSHVVRAEHDFKQDTVVVVPEETAVTEIFDKKKLAVIPCSVKNVLNAGRSKSNDRINKNNNNNSLCDTNVKLFCHDNNTNNDMQGAILDGDSDMGDVSENRHGVVDSTNPRSSSMDSNKKKDDSSSDSSSSSVCVCN